MKQNTEKNFTRERLSCSSCYSFFEDEEDELRAILSNEKSTKEERQKAIDEYRAIKSEYDLY